VAEPVEHFTFISNYQHPREAAPHALFITIFHWGLHAWAIYGVSGLIMAYFSYRLGRPQLLSSPLRAVLGDGAVVRSTGFVVDTLAIYATAIGLAGSLAMGVFQVQSGVARILGLAEAGMPLALGVFFVLCAACALPLMVELGSGMAKLSNVAIVLTIGIMVFILLVGPTHFIMSSLVEMFGQYAANVIPHGFTTFSLWEQDVATWFSTWTLNYMVWWLAWSPFVGVFIARISKGRTIREYIAGVLLVPTGFSLCWFGILGSAGFYQAYYERFDHSIVAKDINAATFALLESFPLAMVTSGATILAAFLFIVTSVVSAAYVLAMFSNGGDPNPTVRLKLTWGAVLGALGLVMVITNSVAAVRSIIALSANPFIFIVLLLFVCLLRALKRETGAAS
jgi:glycine betaine transporter